MNACAASPLNFGYGGPERHVSKPLLRSTNHVPVRSNGAFARGFLRLAGASAPSCSCGAACATESAAAASTSAPASAVATTRTLFSMIPPGDILTDHSTAFVPAFDRDQNR